MCAFGPLEHQKAKFIEEASQYYERLKSGAPCNEVDAVIKIRSLIQNAGCSLIVLEPTTPKGKEQEEEQKIRDFLESKLGKIAIENKNRFIREAIEYYETLKSGHPCNIALYVREIRICLNNAGVSLAALEPEIPESRKKEVDNKIRVYLERLEHTQDNNPQRNPPPSFFPESRKKKFNPPSQPGGFGR